MSSQLWFLSGQQDLLTTGFARLKPGLIKVLVKFYFCKAEAARVLIKLDRPVCLACYSQKGSLKIPPIAADFLLAYKICHCRELNGR